VVLVTVIVRAVTGGSHSSTTATTVASATSLAATTSTAIPKLATVSYQIVNETHSRYDGAPTEYVLINPVNLSTTQFKNDVRSGLRDIVRKNGGKISVEIHESAGSLAVSYRQHGDMSLGRTRTSAEDDIEARHFVGAYDGELAPAPSPHDLQWFPAAFTSTPGVGPYVGNEEYDAASSS
jgi:hypothetical protein